MTTMMLSGERIDVAPNRVLYNTLRQKYQVLAEQAAQKFAAQYSGNFQKIDDVHEKCNAVAADLFYPIVEEAVRDLIARKIFDVDDREFQDYMEPYFSWPDDFSEVDEKYLEIVLKAEELDAYRTQRREGRGKWIGGGFGIGGAVQGALKAGAMNLATGAVHGTFNLMAKGMSAIGDAMKKTTLFNNPSTKESLVNAIYRAAFGIHFALIDALNDKQPNTITGYVADEDASKAERLLENAAKGRVPEHALKPLLLEALALNPYDETFYRIWLEKYGDESGALEEIETFFGVYVSRRLKKDLIEARMTTLDLSTPEACASSLVTLESYAKSIGYRGFDVEKNDILTLADRLDRERRTVNGIVHPNVAAAVAAKVQQDDDIARTVKGKVYATHEAAEHERTKKTIGIGFILGMIFLPIVTPFFTLRKGYSTQVRAVSFGILALICGMMIFESSKAPNQVTAAKPVSQPISVAPITAPAEPQITTVAMTGPPPANQSPFIGRRIFNFMGGNGTQQSILIQENGQTRVEFLGSTGSSVDYEGPFSNPLRLASGSALLFKDNKVFLLKNNQVEKDCADIGKECVSELYPD